MANQGYSKRACPPGYPRLTAVQRSCAIIAQMKPDVVNLTVEAKLHNLGLRKTVALRQVFKIGTLAAQWMARDINQRKPMVRFAKYRKPNSTGYYSEGIAKEIRSAYREKVRGRYTL